MPQYPDPLSGFSEPTRTWFRAAFAEPTPAQAGAWASIASGHHTLVVAPTGSGKTLSAFLASIDRLLTTPTPEDKTKRTRVLYVSPLKALAVDVERNLRAPLIGIRQTAERLASGGRPRPPGRHPFGRHPGQRAPYAHDAAARHPHHHARVPLPDADQPGPRVAPGRRDRDRRRGARRRRHQARRPPRGHPRAARRAARHARPSGSACPRRCVRPRRSPASWAVTHRSRSSPRPRTSRGTCRWSSRSRT